MSPKYPLKKPSPLSSVVRRRNILTPIVMLAFAAAGAGGPVSAAILDAKRGFGGVGTTYDQLQASGAGWYYTWGTNPGTPSNYNADFYPMFWNAPSQATIDAVAATNPSHVLGFNEPDNPDQANMTVAQAIDSWKQISAAFAGTSTELISPAVEDTPTGQRWLTQFMSQANADGLKVNAVAFHWYDVDSPTDPAAAASEFLNSVNWYYDTFHLPVYVTEFAIHDFNGGYTAAQMQAGNEQFLADVLPQLNSLSYVAGYSFYNDFSNTPLISGTTPEPTPMAYNYVGAVTSGTTTNIGGQNLGEHVAYLAGGTLTMNNTPGEVKYIDALANASTVTGNIDWSLSPNSPSDWVRIAAGASLVKAGTDYITLGAGTITNNGTIMVQQGSLLIGAPTSGSGSIDVNGGILIADSTIANPIAISSGSTMSGSGTINSTVRVAGTLKAGQGNAPGTLTINTLQLNDGSRVIMVLDKPNASAGTDGNSLILTQNLTLGSNITLDLMHDTGFTTGIYHLFSVTGGTTGIGNLRSWVINGPNQFNYELSDAAGTINLTVDAVPEPSNIDILAIGTVGLFAYACRQRGRRFIR